MKHLSLLILQIKAFLKNLMWYNYKIKLKSKRSSLKQEDIVVLLLQKKVINFFIVYELNLWPQGLNTYFNLGSCLFQGVKL